MSEVSSSGEVDAVRYSRTQLLIILITPLLVLLASTALYFSGLLLPDETSNKGVLLTPVLSVTDLGYPEVVIGTERHWTLIQLSPVCADSCGERLYEQRQMHIALGKLESRIERVLLTETPLGQDEAALYPRLQVRTLASDAVSAALRSRIPAADLADDIVFVADPFGNIMLYFTNAHDYRAQISDLKKLLKLSTIG
ncbi:hypothetical protein [Reinekea sp.]|uniref:hypothetical protein n=1 Tax=Reinekea sp. TaxID=1970455 RepID=UPI002A834078|nr:hypothetical protein [Reinekea sp.]